MKTPRKPAKAATQSDDLLSMEDAIARLKTTRPTFYRWLKTGKLRGMKVGRQWRFYRKDIEGFLRGEGLRYDLPVGVEPLISALRKRIGEKDAPVSSLSDAEKLQMASDLVVRVGITLKASDVHLDTIRDQGRLRYRVNGTLVVTAEFDAKLVPALVTRFKAWGKCDVNTRTVPQDARIPYSETGNETDLLMSFLPSLGGETMTLRLLDRGVAAVSLDMLMTGYPAKDELTRALSARSGIIVVSGPTGSGKTSVLYACVNQVATPNNKVISIEDPIEYAIPGVVQVPVNRSEGVTAPAALKAALRSDPNVIVIGEIRDAETADLACKAAITGHLVLTTMHARDTGHVLSRLLDLGIAPQMMAESLILVTSQKLVRKVCKDCGTKESPDGNAIDWAQKTAEPGGINWSDIGRNFRKGAGCAKCNMTGFKGRSLAIETLKVDSEIARLIREGNPEKVRMLAVKKGMRTMEADAVRQAGEGITSLEEVRREME